MRQSIGWLILLGSLLAAMAAAPRSAMPAPAVALLREAVAAAPEYARAENLRGLERLAAAPLPRVTALPYLHVRLHDTKGDTVLCAWLAGEDDATVTLVGADGQEAVMEKALVLAREPADLAADLRAECAALKAHTPEQERPWHFMSINENAAWAFSGGYREHATPVQLACIAAEAGLRETVFALLSDVLRSAPQAMSTCYNNLVWREFRPAMLAFQNGTPRDAFLQTCRRLQETYPGSQYAQELTSLITAMQREAEAPLPRYLTIDAGQRTQDETIQYLIYLLRDVAGRQWGDPGYPTLFSADFGGTPGPMERLVAIGPPAIPFLIDALEDTTPSRTIAWQRSFYPVYFVLRRQDLALKTLERITGCRFYNENATYMHFYLDTSDRRTSVLNNVRAWWKISQGVPQAQAVRNQVRLNGTNMTLNLYDQLRDLETLEALEGPEAVLEDVRRIQRNTGGDLNDPVRTFLMEIDPRTPVREALERFAEQRCRQGDYTLLFQYGDRQVYAEMARRFTATNLLDPSPWSMADEFAYTARYGKQWAIPILGHGLTFTQMTGSRSLNSLPAQTFSAADVALEELQKLTGKDFGYAWSLPEAQRLALIAKARAWWKAEGPAQTKAALAVERPVPTADLLQSDAEIDATVAAIASRKADERRAAVARLREVRSYRVQRALIEALPHERLPAERRRILQALATMPRYWHLPAYTTVLREDDDLETRVQAAHAIANILANKLSMIWSVRLETRDAALELARQLLRDTQTPSPLHDAAFGILKAWGSWMDAAVLKAG
jgi:hypothetical protein